MKHTTIWRLTVHWYPHATAAGVQPVNLDGAACDRCSLAEGKIHRDAFYCSHEFQFVNPPSREDFVLIVRSLPWADHSWGNTLIPLIEAKTSQWPMIDYGHKASWADVFDSDGRKVGHLEVRREAVHQNQPYHTAFVTVDAVNHATWRLGDKREAAKVAIWKNENWIQERTTDLARQEHEMPESFLGQVVREFLIKAGFVKAKPSRKRAGRIAVNQ